MGNSKAFRFGAAFAAFGLVLSSTAHAAPSGLTAADPLVSLSVFGTSSSRAAVCAAGTAAAGAAATAATTAATTGQAPPQNCVLPVLGDQPVAAVVEPVVPVAAPSGFNISSWLPLAAILGLGLLAILLLENEDDTPPLSPA